MTFRSGALPLTHFSATPTPFAAALNNAANNCRPQQPVLAQSISMMPSRAALTRSHRQGFGSSAEALMFRPTVWDNVASHLYSVFRGDRNLWTGGARQGFRWTEVDGKLAGFSLEDLMSRFTTLFAVYIPQNYIAIKEHKHPMETFGRNMITWFSVFGLTALLKRPTLSFPSMMDKWLLNEKKLGFDYKDLLRVGANRLPSSGLDAARASLYQGEAVSSELALLKEELGSELAQWKANPSNKELHQSLETKLRGLLDFSEHQFERLSKKYAVPNVDPSGIVNFAEKIVAKGPLFLKRLALTKFLATAINTVIFAVLIGDFVLRLNWLTFARLDKDFKPAPKAHKKGQDKGKPMVPTLQVLLALPANLQSVSNQFTQYGGRN